MTALEEACEDYFIELLGLNADLQGISIVPFEDDDEAIAPAIVVQAIQKGHRLDGPKGFDVDVTCLYRATTTAPTDSHKIAGAIRKSIYSSQSGQTAAEGVFGYLMILDENLGGDRQTTRDLKKRSVTVSLIARIE